MLLRAHSNGTCRCTLWVNPSFCIYQPFLDGWDFTPDVGNGASRGEVFTPRFVVDKMIVKAGILPARVIYKYDYSGSQGTLRKYIGSRVFEPAVGTGNFLSTVLWHKLELAHALTGVTSDATARCRKSSNQLRRYQTYTLVALASLYFNDIDAGNLQTVKWRLLRDQEIGTEENIDFWVQHVRAALPTLPSEEDLRTAIAGSIKLASRNWGTADRDRGVLDTLHEKHTGLAAPRWLQSSWKMILDENGKLFNAIEGTPADSSLNLVPSNRDVVWKFWYFKNSPTRIRAFVRHVPLRLQLLEGELAEVEESLSLVPMSQVENGQLDLYGETPLVPDGREAMARHRSLSHERHRLLQEIASYDSSDGIEEFDVWTRNTELTEKDPRRVA